MPWTANEAERHTHKATTPALKELWASYLLVSERINFGTSNLECSDGLSLA
jgi:hypothetical protein